MARRRRSTPAQPTTHPGRLPYDPDIFIPDIQALGGQYDIVIPYFHFGIEYVEALPDWAVDGARSAIDAGATLVVTNHPHVIQGMEFYTGTPIVYSVGNFIFDQMFSVQTREGLILELVMRGKKCVGCGHAASRSRTSTSPA